MKKFFAFLVLIIAICLIGYIVYVRFPVSKWVKVQQKPIATAVYGLGTVTSEQILRLRAGVLTVVKKVYVKEGDVVKKGDRLVSLLQQPLIIAPFAGTITNLPIYKDEVIHPTDNILTLANLKQRYILVSMEQKNIVQIRRGQKTLINFESLRNKTFTGSITRIYPHNNEFFLKIVVQNMPENILPGMTADVAIEVRYNSKALVIPLQAVKNEVVVVKRGEVGKKVKVKIRPIDEGFVEVLSNNLTAKDYVLVNSGFKKAN